MSRHRHRLLQEHVQRRYSCHGSVEAPVVTDITLDLRHYGSSRATSKTAFVARPTLLLDTGLGP